MTAYRSPAPLRPCERVFMIAGTGVHDQLDWPFTITGMFEGSTRSRDAGGDTLTKRSKTPHTLREGQTVRDRLGSKAKITKLDITHAELEFGPGHTGISLLGDLEAA